MAKKFCIIIIIQVYFVLNKTIGIMTRINAGIPVGICYQVNIY